NPMRISRSYSAIALYFDGDLHSSSGFLDVSLFCVFVFHKPNTQNHHHKPCKILNDYRMMTNQQQQPPRASQDIDTRVKLSYLKLQYKKLRQEHQKLHNAYLAQQEQVKAQEKLIRQLRLELEMERELSEDALLMLHNDQNLLAIPSVESDTDYNFTAALRQELQ